MSRQQIDSEKLTHFWITEAEESLQVAENLVASRDYSYALFFGHLAIEKLLKALHTHQLNTHAPPIHNLVGLATRLDLKTNQTKLNALTRITTFNIQARYPDFKRSFRKKCTPAYTARQMRVIQGLFRWLRSQLP
jgi:HEPN domain-containing protein